MIEDDHIASTRQHVLASQQAIKRLLASVDRASAALRPSREAIRASRAVLSVHAPRPESVLPAKRERELERWRMAAQIVRALKDAGAACELSIPVRPH
jgi:hypothetical protein